jgi:hypothetical protein
MRAIETVHDGPAKPVCPVIAQRSQLGHRQLRPLENRPRVVGAAVIDDKDFVGNRLALQFAVEVLDGCRDTARLVARGNDHGEQRQRRRRDGGA